MRRAATRPPDASSAQNGAAEGAPDTLDAQIDDLLANIEAENEPWDGAARRGRRRRLRRTRRVAYRIRRIWALRRTTALLAAALFASIGIAVATVYLAAQVLG